MRILKDDVLGLVIDLQEKLVPLVDGPERLITKNRLLIEGLNLLDIPIILTEQYPRGLGKTVAGISDLFVRDIPYEKHTFSCLEDPGIRSRIQSFGKKTVIIAGIEAHVCVLQTVLDLGAMGMTPVVVADAVSSRSVVDRQIALDRISATGGCITTVESVLFELMRTAQHPSFKAISKLIKESAQP
jgi:nicotinamidase-related amidase